MKALIVSVFLMTSFSSQAMTGNEMYERYKTSISDDKQILYDYGMFRGYVWGVMDGSDLSSFICAKGLNMEQAVDVIGKFLKDNPSMRNEEGPVIISLAMYEAFPCEE